MSTPNPLVPQGSIQPQGGSNVRIAVATVVAIHVVFFGGLLLQGCKREPKVEANAAATNTPAADPLTYPPLETASAADTNSLYYKDPSTLPAAATATNTGLPATGAGSAAGSGAGAVQPSPFDPIVANSNTPAVDPWKQGASAVNAAAVAPEALGGKEYTVVRGDSFAKIAKMQGSTVAAIKQANPTVDPAKIRPGMKLIVPSIAPPSNAAATPANGAQNAVAAPAAGSPAGTYVVKSGDTLTRIAKNHGVTVGQLREANNLKTSRVNVGQKLKIPAGKAAAAAPTNQAAAPSPNATF